jgi:tetratricopeptide (TPR) repeat protein
MGSHADIIKVSPMDREDALTLFQRRLGQDFEQGDAAALVEALDYMSLAISQAAAYINKRTPLVTVSRYMYDLQKGDRDRATLLETDLEDLRRDGTSSNSILATWQISFEHINKTRPSASRLLSIMSLFDRQEIPKSLLSDCRHQEGDASVDLEDNLSKLEDDLDTLISLSLVSTADGCQFAMHRLVQFSTRKWLELQGEQEDWMQLYASAIYRNLPKGNYEDWKKCRMIFPHVQAAMAYRPTDKDIMEIWANVLLRASWYALGIGNYTVAREMCRSSLETLEAAQGAEIAFKLGVFNGLGVVLYLQGKYEEAEAIHRQDLKTAEKMLGPDGYQTIISLNCLGWALHGQGKYEEAEAMYRRGLKAAEKVLGPDHGVTLEIFSGIAALSADQGKYEEAESMHRRTLEAEEKRYGRDDPSTLVTFSHLGLVLSRQGKYEEAELIHQQTLEAKKRILGPDHPCTIDSVCYLANVFYKQGRYAPALEVYQAAYNGYVRTLGPDHPMTIARCNDISIIEVEMKQS